MIGGLPNQIYHEESIQLFEHDSIFFYTDGIIEAQNKRGEQFTLARLIETLKQNQDKNAGEIEKKCWNRFINLQKAFRKKMI